MSQNHTALVVTEIGKPLTKALRPVPKPKDGEVLFKVTVAGLNAHDAKSRDYGLFIADALPAVLAADVAGVVTRVGARVTRFEEGDHVFGQTSLIEILMYLSLLVAFPYYRVRSHPLSSVQQSMTSLVERN